jgi:HAE1 family hydrophobic/amphiphilic exporter-1
LNPTDVTAAISEQSREAAAGSIGQNSGSSFEYIIKYVGNLMPKNNTTISSLNLLGTDKLNAERCIK